MPVPQSAGPPGDSSAADRGSQHGFEEGCCRGRKGCVTYDGRESPTFNGVPGNLSEIQARIESGKGAIMYLTPRSRATNRNESQYMSSVPDQPSLESEIDGTLIRIRRS